MILQQLRSDSDRLVDLPPSMYDLKPVRWVVSLRGDGTLERFIRTDGEGKAAARGQPRLVPQVKRTVGIRPLLLADTPAYTFGLPEAGENGKADRAEAKHEAYLQLVEQCARETGEPAVEAVRRFLVSWAAGSDALPEEMTPGDLITFRVDGVYPVDLPAVRAFWAANAREAKGEKREGQQCLVCGQRAAIVDRHPVRIKGIPEGQPSGTDLVSVNAAAFESYGLAAAYSSPTCQDCGERYAKALNALLIGERTHLRVGPSAFVFWTSAGSFEALSFLSQPDPETVKDLLASYQKGVRRAQLDTTDFYATALSANSSRAVVRDWLHTTVGRVQDQLARWFALLETTDPYGQPGTPLGVFRLAASLYRDASKEMVAQVPRQLVRAALYGDPLPASLLALAVRRNRAEQDVTYPRAALTKAVLLSSSPDLEEYQRMSIVDPKHPEPAYHCGRLLAELEGLQQAANPGINTTLVDRFYGAASTAPASAFGNLLRDGQAHLSVLRRTRRGAYQAIQQRLEEILAALGGQWPASLTLQEQAYFSLGYYHQRAHNRAQAIEAKAAREARAADAGDPHTDLTDEEPQR